jgi:hypothetical protein
VAGRKPGIEKLEVAGESATSSQWVRYERCLSNSELLKFSIPQLLSDQFARVLVSPEIHSMSSLASSPAARSERQGTKEKLLTAKDAKKGREGRKEGRL